MSDTETIDQHRVEEILTECLINTPEGEEVPADAVIVKGILHDYAFAQAKLDEHRDEVRSMLEMLPDQFFKSRGGGWSFLNACYDRNEVQWTGMHWMMEMLFCLGIGMGMVSWALPREMWSAFPGGMPYVVVDL